MTTTTLFKIISSELHKMGFNEIEVGKNKADFSPYGNFVFFDSDYQFTEKVLNFDTDVQKIVNYFFHGQVLQNKEHDLHFKKTFLMRFVNRQINRQTVEAFKMELMYTLESQRGYIERVYNDLEKYILNHNISNSSSSNNSTSQTKGNDVSDSRSAYSDLPQDSYNLDVNNSVMTAPNDNTISKTKNVSDSSNTQDGESQAENSSDVYSLDNLIKSSTLMESIFNVFDKKCFLQIW